MKVLHLNAGNESGGGMVHILSLLKELNKDEFFLGLFEKGIFEEKAKAAGIHTVTFEQTSRYDLSILFKIIKFIKEEKIDILHTHGPRANLYGYLIKKFTSVIWMTTVHSDPRNDFLGRGVKGKLFTQLNLAVLKKPDHYFAISKRFTEMLEEFGVGTQKITTIYNGIDFSFTPNKKLSREELKLSVEDFVILMVARLDPVKRHKLAIDAVEKAIQLHPQIKLLLVGDGPLKDDLRKLIKEKGLEHCVTLFGHREDVDAFYDVADITLLTSQTESFPLVLLESARSCTPVITTDVGGVGEMIPDSSYGFIVRGDEKEEIVSAISTAVKLKEKDNLSNMGIKFYNYVSKRFSLESFAKSIYNTYRLYCDK
ncbi:glycosyltransferase [Neobacillus sedimentimangrovi]|jgi:L-malate glycosyltransferase|uniref:glycosyltransferase n=1 Tax=Neobacillus sedimentimangrovi TaxID=2699460 RepID=UPI0013D1C261|nr:glycosyltransferase [Neobacillus sedimentimangrovi]